MEIILFAIRLLTALTGLATAIMKLCTQSTEQRRTLADKEGSDVTASEPHSKNGTAR
jgi:hypothetical protein